MHLHAHNGNAFLPLIAKQRQMLYGVSICNDWSWASPDAVRRMGVVSKHPDSTWAAILMTEFVVEFPQSATWLAHYNYYNFIRVETKTRHDELAQFGRWLKPDLRVEEAKFTNFKLALYYFTNIDRLQISIMHSVKLSSVQQLSQLVDVMRENCAFIDRPVKIYLSVSREEFEKSLEWIRSIGAGKLVVLLRAFRVVIP